MTFSWLAKNPDRYNPLTGKLRIWRRGTWLVLTLAVAVLGGMSPAEAVQDPPNCTSNTVALGLSKGAVNQIVNGQKVTYTITLANGDTPSCSASNLTIQAFCPNANGQSLTPATINVVNAIPNPLGVPTAVFTVGTFDCTVTVNPGVGSAQARATLAGILNDLAGANDPLTRESTVSVNIITEGMSVSKSCFFAEDQTTVNVSGTVTNTGSDTLINLECTDSPAGEPLSLSDNTIPPGGQVSFSGSFASSSNPSTDTVTCTATGEAAQVQVGPESASATCAFLPPPPPAIPTLSGWVMILLAVFLAVVGATTVLRRKPTV